MDDVPNEGSFFFDHDERSGVRNVVAVRDDTRPHAVTIGSVALRNAIPVAWSLSCTSTTTSSVRPILSNLWANITSNFPV